MKEVDINDINRYVHRISIHPFENIDELSKVYFEDCLPSMANKKAVVPELLNIPLRKRALVVNIIKEKMNYSVSPVDESKMHIIRETGEALEPIYKPSISVVQEHEDSIEDEII